MDEKGKRGSKPKGITGRTKGGSPRAPGPGSPQQCLDHLPTWLWLIFAPCRQSSSCQLITLEQAENVAGFGLLFLLLALHEFCNQLLMSLSPHTVYSPPLLLWLHGALSLFCSPCSSTTPPCMQRVWEMPIKHTQSFLCLSPAAFPMQNEIIPQEEEALCSKWQSRDGVFCQADREEPDTPLLHSLQHKDECQDRLQRGKEGREIQVWNWKEQPKSELYFCLGQAAPFPGGLSALPEHAGHHEGI